MNLPQLFVCGLGWLVCAWVVLSTIAGIPVYRREITRKRWVRIMSVFGGPVTIVIIAVVIAVGLFIGFVYVTLRDEFPRKIRALMNQPSSPHG